jgi:hypothetical protein
MAGHPVQQSNILMAALHNIALKNKDFQVKVMLSYTRTVSIFDLPFGTEDNPTEIATLQKTGSDEWLWENIKDNIDIVQNADLNLVFTDGSIVSSPIDKLYLEKRDVTMTGMYVSDVMGVEDVKEHYSRNKQWFHNVIVRPSVEELADEIADRIFAEVQ